MFIVLSFFLLACSSQTEIIEQPQQPLQEAPIEEPPTPEPIPALPPVEAEPIEETPKEEETPKFVIKENQATNIEYDDKLMVTEIACNYADSTISFHLKNTETIEKVIWQGEIPTPENHIRISVNGRQFNSPKNDLKLHCIKMMLNPGEEMQCFGENIFYRGDALFNQQGKNRLLAQSVVVKDLTLFQCG